MNTSILCGILMFICAFLLVVWYWTARLAVTYRRAYKYALEVAQQVQDRADHWRDVAEGKI
jgi:hypothetical protein